MKLRKKLNGYMAIDFSMAVFLFILFFFTITQYYINSLDSYESLKDSLVLKSTSLDICKLLISSSGVPNTWENNFSNLNTIGLLKENTTYLDPKKIFVLSNNSNNNLSQVFSKIIGKNSSLILNIKIINLSDNFEFLNFNSSSTIFFKNKAISNCFSNYNNTNPVRIEVEVWK